MWRVGQSCFIIHDFDLVVIIRNKYAFRVEVVPMNTGAPAVRFKCFNSGSELRPPTDNSVTFKQRLVFSLELRIAGLFSGIRVKRMYILSTEDTSVAIQLP